MAKCLTLVSMRSMRILLAMWVTVGVLSSAEPPTFKRDIAPIFKAKCQKCHGFLVKQKGLSLRSLKSIRKGGESGAVVVPGKPESSLLVQQLSLPTKNPKRMPPIAEKAQLTKAEKQLIARWVKAGAK